MRNYRLDSPTLRACTLLATAAMAFVAACTSSSTGTSVQSNQNFDSNYRGPTTSTQQYPTDQAKAESAEPVYTMMEIGTETGEIYPGEDYAVFAVVDKPQNIEIEYHWSTTNGDLLELPEADRGRIQTLIEQEDQAIRASGVAKPDDTAAGGATPPADGAVTPATGTDAAAAGTTTPVAPLGGASGATGPVTPAPASPAPGTTPPLTTPKFTIDQLQGEQANFPQRIKELLVRQRNNEQLTPDELKELTDYMGGPGRDARMGTASLYERRFVGAPARLRRTPAQAEPDAAGSEAVEGPVEPAAETEVETDAEQLAEDALAAAKDELEDFRDGATAADNVAEGGAAGREVTISETSDRPRAGSLRDEYETWSTGTTDVRRRNLGGIDEEEASDEEMTAEDSYKASTFVTDVPYVQWTPSTAGESTLYCKIVLKDEDQTDPKPLHVDVTLREPKVEIADDFPDIIREDDNVLIRLDAENLPDFKKGLFTLTFDPDVLSFRDAELGEFFDDAAGADIYFAEPDKTAGKVLLALDSNTELAELSGDGPLVYAQFKAKQDIEAQEDTGLAMVLDSTARYILDRNDDNILPTPVDKQPLRSEVTVPPLQTDVVRDAVPATLPAAGTTTPGATTQTPLLQTQPGGSTSLSPQPTGSNQSPAPGTGSSDKTVVPVPARKAASTDKPADGAAPLAPVVGPAAPPSGDADPDAEMIGPVLPQPLTEEEEKKAEAAKIGGKSN